MDYAYEWNMYNQKPDLTEPVITSRDNIQRVIHCSDGTWYEHDHKETTSHNHTGVIYKKYTLKSEYVREDD